MKIVTAIDSMKGSLTSVRANQIIAEVFTAFGHDVSSVAIADGGEGTVAALVENNHGKLLFAEVQALNGQQITASYGWFAEKKLAVIESAQASGIQFLNGTTATHPKNTSSYGTGELILAAIKQGAQTIVIGLGGTGTVDGGIGLLSALGAAFFDKNGRQLPAKGSSLSKVASYSLKNVLAEMKQIQFIIAADVFSPLTGEQGAVKMFGRQKGLRDMEIDAYEAAMQHYQNVVQPEKQTKPGDGAAGGLGFAIRHFLKGTVVSGFEYIAEQTNLAGKIEQADLVITGEGRIDAQSLQGKVPVGIARIAQKAQVPVLAFVGSCIGESAQFADSGISVIVPIVDQIMTLETALKEADQNLYRAAERSARLLSLFN
ncbi:glycerate kinase [Erwinia sp. CPCC 100877]|nr:glycerate kinase [Erwinia sp. CPCC 100877]